MASSTPDRRSLRRRPRSAGRLLLAVGLGLLPACASAAPVEAWSFNLRYGSADDGAQAWPRRVDFVQELLGAARPDLLGVQEALPFQVAAVAAALPDHDYWGRSRTEGPGGEQCGVYWNRTRFRRLDGGHLWLSPRPDEVGSQGWDAALPRMASWVLLQDRVDGGEVLVCSTHFDHRGGEARLQSARLLAERLPMLAEGRPMVLLGDFNADAGSAPWQALAGPDAPFLDTWTACHGESASAGTFHGFRGTPDGRRIDWVLVSPQWRVREAEVLRPRREGLYASDHEPVRARFESGR